MQAGLGRNDRRTIVGGRWEHDFDNTTTWRNQFVFDDRNISQPTGTTSAIGDFPSYNYMSDVTKRGEILGMDSTTFFGGFYNTLACVERHAQRHARAATPRSVSSQANLLSETTNYGVRAREELKLTPVADGGCGHRLGNHHAEGDQLRPTAIQVHGRADRVHDCRPAIPEHRARTGAALQAEHRVAVPRHASPRVTAHRRSETCLSSPTVSTATTPSSRRRRISATISVSTGRRTMR